MNMKRNNFSESSPMYFHQPYAVENVYHPLRVPALRTVVLPTSSHPSFPIPITSRKSRKSLFYKEKKNFESWSPNIIFLHPYSPCTPISHPWDALFHNSPTYFSARKPSFRPPLSRVLLSSPSSCSSSYTPSRSKVEDWTTYWKTKAVPAIPPKVPEASEIRFINSFVEFVKTPETSRRKTLTIKKNEKHKSFGDENEGDDGRRRKTSPETKVESRSRKVTFGAEDKNESILADEIWNEVYGRYTSTSKSNLESKDSTVEKENEIFLEYGKQLERKTVVRASSISERKNKEMSTYFQDTTRLRLSRSERGGVLGSHFFENRPKDPPPPPPLSRNETFYKISGTPERPLNSFDETFERVLENNKKTIKGSSSDKIDETLKRPLEIKDETQKGNSSKYINSQHSSSELLEEPSLIVGDETPKGSSVQYITETPKRPPRRKKIKNGIHDPLISSPILLTSTFNPNDAERHISLNNSEEPIYEEIFERHFHVFGSSKVEILHYLKDAKERMSVGCEIGIENLKLSSEIERNDSGVGSETSQSSKSKIINKMKMRKNEENEFFLGDKIDSETTCLDCESQVEFRTLSFSELKETQQQQPQVRLCHPCRKLRSERKETLAEIVETEVKYGRDLRIIIEEFLRPMRLAGLLFPDQLSSIFLNCEELLDVHESFVDKLLCCTESAGEKSEDDWCSKLQVGSLFLEFLNPMLKAFEYYCTRQGSASLLLTNLEKEKELLRIFLKVSQMENHNLRRMNLNSFLMVPVQRVTKYPLLLSRLFKVTSETHEDRYDIKKAQDKIEEALEQMNKDAKDANTNKLWKRIPKMTTNPTPTTPTSPNTSSPTKNLDTVLEMSNVRIRKMALDLLGWNKNETRFPLEGKMSFCASQELNWKKMWTFKLSPISAVLALCTSEELPEMTSSKSSLIFPSESSSFLVKDACLLLVKEKNSKLSLVRDPLPLDRCIICCEPDWDDVFEIQEFISKESYVFKGDRPEDTAHWFKTLQFYSQSLGGWRKRRKGLGNIMFDSNLISSLSLDSQLNSDENEDDKEE